MSDKERTTMRDRNWNLVIAWSATLMLAGCSAGAAPNMAISESASTSSTVTGASSATRPASTPASSATAPSAAAFGGKPLTLKSGSAHVTLAGGTTQEFDIALGSGILIPGSNVILSWSGPPGDESDSDALRIQAPSRAGVYLSAGTALTAPQISLTTGRVGTAGVPPQFAPIADECTVTLTKVDATGVDGSLDCRGLISTAFDRPIDLTATYTTAP